MANKHYILTDENNNITGTRYEEETKADPEWIEVQSPVYGIWTKDGEPIYRLVNGAVSVRPGFENAKRPMEK